jgi:hypothetical protein
MHTTSPATPKLTSLMPLTSAATALPRLVDWRLRLALFLRKSQAVEVPSMRAATALFVPVTV